VIRGPQPRRPDPFIQDGSAPAGAQLAMTMTSVLRRPLSP
jgi:hypothetical protein